MHLFLCFYFLDVLLSRVYARPEYLAFMPACFLDSTWSFLRISLTAAFAVETDMDSSRDISWFVLSWASRARMVCSRKVRSASTTSLLAGFSGFLNATALTAIENRAWKTFGSI